MKKVIQYFCLIIFLLLISCGSDSTEEIEFTTSISTSLKTIPFSDTEVNTSSELSFTVSNTGNTSINNANITNSNSIFSVSPTTFSLSENESKTFTVTFSPGQDQNYADTFTLKLGETVLGSLKVTGKGIITMPITSIQSSKTSLSFADVQTNNTKQLTFSINNTGNQNINSIILSKNSAQFIINPTSFSLAVNASKTITVDFTPTKVQSYNDVITITAENTILANVNLSGNGIESIPATTYTKDIQPIMNNSCATTGCHKGTNPASGIGLETYALTKDAFENHGALIQIELGEMPRNASKLPQVTIDLIKKWIADGYPE
ncbi:choice-of-anchor D domain-containing protein [Wenyingzhuangia sp. chi5]|uniref:Choice-of-anchor D domain-containing protein n=1 Tax=Wenyingzhuangia gilva TaxID=3057677 RepID=A0ABT8VQQ4_9FLAO|nr:choice-of-anchor D domain-containing protein [Wenyingzhuangia sp. chi5]MDO3694298.1 choice-of-anchor D domain-containing protein [Wenyingzhuangia sp. chi5]